jgi:DNA-binding beta-propeller fold protein YncE
VLAVVLLVGAAAYLLLGRERAPAPPTATEPAPSDLPEFLYAVAPEEGDPFRPRGAIIVEDIAYVADSEGARVVVLDLLAGRETALRFIPIVPERPGDALGRRPQPAGIAALPDGTLAVTDAANGRVWRVGTDGSFLGDLIPEQELERADLGVPVGLAADESRIYVTDVGDQTVKLFTATGRFVRRLGGEGFRPGRLSFPHGVLVAGESLYIADSNNGRVQVVDADGTPLHSLGEGPGDEDMRLPRGLAVDREGRLHVVDTFAQVVLVYSGESLRHVYGTGEEGQGALALPEGVAVSADRIVVSDAGNQRLAVFSY